MTPYMKRMPGAVWTDISKGTWDVKYSVDTIEDLQKCEALIMECGEGARWQDYVEAHRRLYAKQPG